MSEAAWWRYDTAADPAHVKSFPEAAPPPRTQRNESSTHVQTHQRADHRRLRFRRRRRHPGRPEDLRRARRARPVRSEEHTSELQSLMRISYAVFCLKKKNTVEYTQQTTTERL